MPFNIFLSLCSAICLSLTFLPSIYPLTVSCCLFFSEFDYKSFFFLFIFLNGFFLSVRKLYSIQCRARELTLHFSTLLKGPTEWTKRFLRNIIVDQECFFTTRSIFNCDTVNHERIILQTAYSPASFLQNLICFCPFRNLFFLSILKYW